MLQSTSVKDYMTANLVTFPPDMDVLVAIQELLEHRISGAPVVDSHGNMVGMLSEKDCLKVALNAAYNEYMGGQISEFMSNTVVTVDADSNVLDVAKRFVDTPYKRFPVVDDNRLVGQISRRDVLKAIQALR